MKASARHLPLAGHPGLRGSPPSVQSQSLLNKKNLLSCETLPIASELKHEPDFAFALQAPVA
jgi:hypothetical protein